MVKNYDFSGWATRNNIKCSDGRTIRKDAFKHHDGQTVPLVWNHDHKDADNVLGHVLLENRDEGVYAYGFFNDTPQGANAKKLVQHKDVSSLSIYANRLKGKNGDVLHGMIREVSLVLAGANPGAYIDTILEHGVDGDEEATIYNPSEDLKIIHMDKEKDLEKEKNMKSKEEKDKDKVLQHEDKQPLKEKTVEDVFNELTEEQKNVVYALIGMAIDEKDEENNNEGENKSMKQNAFEREDELTVDEKNVLTHSEMETIFKDAKRIGSVREAFLQHGITDVSNLFPEEQAINKTPEMIARDMNWVGKVMSRVHKSPFSRVKSTVSNITADAARAKGYIKGNQKAEEVITALKRVTTPTTVYKFQKMDRDDIIDITDFDVISWLKQEMKVMLDEEIARAILVGDGRTNDDDDKINPLNLRPILGDSSTYVTSRILDKTDKTDAELAKMFIQDIIRSRKLYKGSGNPTLFTTEDYLTEMLLLEDTNGRMIYESISKLATTLRVNEIVTVEPMENVIRTDAGYDYTCMGVLVNLNDYNIGADKGGNVEFFEDFDLNFNKHEYLIETRCSGALTKPYSAITFEQKLAEEA